MRLRAAVLPAIVGVTATLLAPAAHATDMVTYEVVSFSNSVPQINVEYIDGTGRKLLEGVPLPWRLEVPLDDARAPIGRGAQVRADWRPFKSKNRTVTVRIYDGQELLCQSTLDIGDATCYGNTPLIN